MKTLFLALTLLLPPAALATPSDPVGALQLTLRGGSDTMVSLPLHRPALVETTTASRSGAQLTLAADLPSLPAEGAFALVMTGPLEGAVLPITASSARTLTVEPGAFDLSILATDAVDGAGAGSVVAVIPYWTLDTVFPLGAGITVSPSRLVARSQVLLFDSTRTGTNQAASDVYFYFSGNGTYVAGWYRFGDMTKLCGTTRLPPGRSFIVRQPAGSDGSLLVTGAVQMAAYRVPLATLAAGVDQDNAVALPVPVTLTLDASALHESGAFAASPSRLVATDQLLVFDNTTPGINKSATAVYFYFAGNGTYAAGWYRFGDMAHPAGSITLKPGEGYVIRRHATAQPDVRLWTALPSYLQ
ncbi:TIGR02597 family protein [Horticoccus luteus]|uniref:TIGR02597 family protein n=1 Tax=Horticoccus luteus TaxID=2862869 RepID=A0A8F9TT44_9BACT|nr:TIGR02597 family protein [Horticoccus luteus]QYM77607.1 TIGR02597 family protein [Horticoccus luteus]